MTHLCLLYHVIYFISKLRVSNVRTWLRSIFLSKHSCQFSINMFCVYLRRHKWNPALSCQHNAASLWRLNLNDLHARIWWADRRTYSPRVYCVITVEWQNVAFQVTKRRASWRSSWLTDIQIMKSISVCFSRYCDDAMGCATEDFRHRQEIDISSETSRPFLVPT